MSSVSSAVLPEKSSAITLMTPAPLCLIAQYALYGASVSSAITSPSSRNCTLYTPDSASLAVASILKAPIMKILLRLSNLFPNKYSPGVGSLIATLGGDPASILNVGIMLCGVSSFPTLSTPQYSML